MEQSALTDTTHGGAAGGAEQEAKEATPVRYATPSATSAAAAAAAPLTFDYSSLGCSVEEVRCERYTFDFVRALTPRSLRACAEEGVLPRELQWRPVHDFSGAASLQTAAGLLAAIPDAATQGADKVDASTAAASMQVQQLRWKDYDACRAHSLLRVRATRRRHISGGLRSSLLGAAATSPAKSAPAAAAAYRGPAHLPALASAPQPTLLQLKDRDRLASTLHLPTAAATDTAATEWECGHDHSRGGGGGSDNVALCMHMRERMLREKAQEERADALAKKEARRVRRQELKDSSPERRLIKVPSPPTTASGHAPTGSQSARARLQTSSSSSSAPRSTRAEILRTAGTTGMVSFFSATQPLPRSSHAHAAARPPTSGSSSDLSATNARASSSSSSSGVVTGATAAINAFTSRLATPASFSATAPAGSFCAVPPAHSSSSSSSSSSQSQASLLAGSFASRTTASLAAFAAHCQAEFDAETSRIAARQEADLRALAAAEALRLASAQKIQRLEHKRLEKARADTARRAAEAAAAQAAREAKLARAEADEAERVARLDAEWADKHAATIERRAEHARELAASIEHKRVVEAAADAARRSKLQAEEAFAHDRMVSELREVDAAFEASKEALDERVREQRALHAQQLEADRLAHANLAAQRAQQLALQRAENHKRRQIAHDRALATATAAAAAAVNGESGDTHASSNAASSSSSCDPVCSSTTSEVEAAMATAAAAAAAAASDLECARSARLLRSRREDALRLQGAHLAAEAASLAAWHALTCSDAAVRERLETFEAAQARQELLEREKRRIEEARTHRNRLRLQRKKDYASSVLADKVAQDEARRQAIQDMKTHYAAQRDEFLQRTAAEVRDFQRTYEQLRTRGALDKITREAKQRQKEIDNMKEER